MGVVGVLCLTATLAFAEDKTDVPVIGLHHLLESNESLVLAAKDAVSRYAKHYPANTSNSVAFVRIDEEPDDFTGGLGSPVTNQALRAFVNTQIRTTRGGHNEFFVSFRMNKKDAVKSIYIGLRDRMGRGGLGMEFALQRVKNEYQIDREIDAILID
jgi:hypothetical protein